MPLDSLPRARILQRLGGLDLSRKFRIVETHLQLIGPLCLASHVMKPLRSWSAIPPLAGGGQGHMLTCQDSNLIDKTIDVLSVVIPGQRDHCDRLREVELDHC